MFNRKRIKELEEQNELLRNQQTTLLQRDLSGNDLGISHGGKRDVYDIYGYPQKPQFRELYKYSRREGIANRVVFGMPKSCWRDGFYLCTENSEGEETVILEDELQTLNRNADGVDGMTRVLERGDALGRIGRFAAVYIGIPDGLDPREPVQTVMSQAAIDSVYFRPFAYDGIEVFQYDMNLMSRRYGLPELYQVRVVGRGDNDKDQATETMVVHYTRVIHIAECLYDSNIEGIPALEPVYNDCLNIDKTLGGSAEAYFRNARGKTAFEIDKDFAASLIENGEAKAQFDEAAKRFTNNWQDQIMMLGAKATTLNTPHASPMDTFKASLMRVQGQTGIPARILTGEGGGQYTGNQDKLAYDVLKDDRQNSFCAGMVQQALEKLAAANVIQLPDDYLIKWNKQDATTEQEAADIGVKRSQSINTLMMAKSSIAGDALDMRSALDACYLQDVAVDDVDLDYNSDTMVDEVDPTNEEPDQN